MIIAIKRPSPSGRPFTESKLYINDIFECYTVEDTDRQLEEHGCVAKVQNKTCIPRGEYSITISKSERFSQLTGNPTFLIEVLNVNCFSGIRIHSGNSSKDTDGCIIVGSINISETDDWVGASKIAYDKLHSKVKAALSAGEKVILKVV
jgi:hypothetical protein